MTTHTTSGPSRAKTLLHNLKPRQALVGFLALGLALAMTATQCSNSSPTSVSDTSDTSSTTGTTMASATTSASTTTSVPDVTGIADVITSIPDSSGIPESVVRPVTLAELRAEVVPVPLNSYDSCDSLLGQIQAAALEHIDSDGFPDPEPEPFYASSSVQEFEFEPARSNRDSDTDATAAELPIPTLPPVAFSEGTEFSFSDGPALASPSASEDFDDIYVSPGADIVVNSASAYSTTNVQVAGVDEADIVKTNGQVIVGLSGQTLWLADVSAANPQVVGELEVSGGRYFEMLLSGDRVFLIGESAVGVANADDTQRLGRNQRTTVVTEISIADPDEPQPGRHLRLEGRYISSRLTPDGHARVVVSSSPLDEVLLVSPTRGQWSQGAARLLNQELVRQSRIDQWLPHYSLHDSTGQALASELLLGCDRVFLPDHFAGFSQVAVVSFDTNEDLAVGDATSVMAEGELVYASAESLYVSHVVRDFTGFAIQPTGGLETETVVHKFALSSNGQARYEGSGAVVGRPLNQFAFHEHNGHLFVATTLSDNRWESFVTSLEDVGDQLLISHKVGNLGKDEEIYAVRYVGNKAYVVTFRQTDPLYVIDLSDPSQLETKGELKITGYSAYLHPIGDDLLLGIGREATNTGQITGLKLSLFDVSDPSDPREIDKLDFDGGSSEVEFDHRAFLWWEASELAVVPVRNDYSGFNGALGVRIRAVPGAGGAEPSYAITLDQRITHDDFEIQGDSGECGWYALPAELSEAKAVTKICPGSADYDDRYQATPELYWCDQSERFTAFELRQLALALAGIADATGDASSSLAGLRSAGNLEQELSAADDGDPYYFQICIPDFNFLAPSILRSLVVGENLWTVSDELLQANDLDTLQRGAQIELPG